jgi:hypothetical protein
MNLQDYLPFITEQEKNNGLIVMLYYELTSDFPFIYRTTLKVMINYEFTRLPPFYLQNNTKVMFIN